MKTMAQKLFECKRHYRGYKLIWDGPQITGHWLIYDMKHRFVGSAQDGELDSRIDEIESEG